MANYGLLYYSTFGNVNKNRYKLEIYQLDYVGASQSVKLVDTPVINYPEIKKGFDWLFTSGIEFSLLSQTDKQFVNMFTNDIQKYKVVLSNYYLNTYYPIWSGFLDTENYEESANEKNNYPVQFTGNDGFKLLERYNYIDSNSTNFSGVTSIWQVIVNCLSKINYDSNYTYLYTNINKSTNINVSTGCTYIVNDDFTTLHKLFIQNENFYDENNIPMNCYDVLKSILESFNLYLFMDCQTNNLYLVDDISYSISGSTQQFYKIYFTDDFTIYDSVTEMLPNIDINTDDLINNYGVKIMSTNGLYQKIPGLKSQKINYLQYADSNVFNFTADNDFSDLGTIVNYSTTDTAYKWQEYRYNTSTTFNKSAKGVFCKYKGYGTNNSNNSSYYIKLLESQFGDVTPEVVFTLKYKLPYINFSSNKYYLKYSINAYFRTKNTPDNPASAYYSIYNAITRTFISIGNKRYCDNGVLAGSWKSTPANDGHDTFFTNSPNQNNNICDNYINNCTIKSKFTPLEVGQLIPLEAGLYGDLTFSLTNYVYGWNGDITVPSNAKTQYLKDVRFNNINIQIVDDKGNALNLDDKMYDAYFDEKYSSGGEIKTIIGTNVDNLPIAKGSLMEFDGTKYLNVNNIHNSRIIISGASLAYTSNVCNIIEKLSLNNILNQYSTDKEALTFDVELLPVTHASISYNKQFPNKRFFLCGLKNDYNNNISTIKLISL